MEDKLRTADEAPLRADEAPLRADEAPLRADAARNRAQIVQAAAELFLARGADVSLDEIAKHAGVGIGTLYRRFPSREALLAATSDERLLSLVETSRKRDGKLEPSTPLREFVIGLVLHTIHYRGLAASLNTVLHSGTPGCQASGEEAHRLLHRAQKSGIVRKDVSVDDLVCVVTAVSLAVEQGSADKSRIAHLVNLFLDGIVKR